MLWPLSDPPAHATCKICGGVSPAFDSCDVNRGGPPGAAARPLSGQALVYFRCSDCGFMFATQLDDWQPSDFSQHIYNDNYIDVDPDYQHDRPVANAAMLLGLLGQPPTSFRLLDFGAGSGLLAEQLRSRGIAADSEDPYSTAPTAQKARSPAHSYDVVCAFEVLEHSPTPLRTLAQIKAHLKPGGLAVISTLLQPADIPEMRCTWWYCAPRNGHISLFSANALTHALRTTGASSAESRAAGLHLAYF